jgi:hypothetical protein
MGKEFGPDFGGVESNGNFWERAPDLREAYPGAVIVHQVRDGRDVVRSVMTRKQRLGRTFKQACVRWVRRNEQLARDIASGLRFRMEDLQSDVRTFGHMAGLMGAEAVDETAWESIRGRLVNQSKRHTFPHHSDWSDHQEAVFWDICGETMAGMGYQTTGAT